MRPIAVGGWQCSFEGVFAEYDELYLPVHGHHQVDNLATAIATSEMFLGRALDPELLLVAVASMSSPGRLEVVGRRPVVIVDGCHNQQGFRGLADTLDAEFPPVQWKLVLAVRGERSIRELLRPMKGRVDQVFATTVADPFGLGTLGGSGGSVRSPRCAGRSIRGPDDCGGGSDGLLLAGMGECGCRFPVSGW